MASSCHRSSAWDAGDLANRRPWTTTSVLIKRAFDSPRSKLGLPCQRLATRVADVLKWNILDSTPESSLISESSHFSYRRRHPRGVESGHLQRPMPQPEMSSQAPP